MRIIDWHSISGGIYLFGYFLVKTRMVLVLTAADRNCCLIIIQLPCTILLTSFELMPALYNQFNPIYSDLFHDNEDNLLRMFNDL